MRRPSASTALLLSTVAATATTLVTGRAEVLVLRVGPLVVALACFGGLLLLARRGQGPSMRAVIGASVLLAAVAVAFPPLHSQDVYLYGMQGRILAVHGSNPYVHEPEDFADDPLLDDVSQPWRDDRSYYGPAFTVVEAGVAAVAGSSPLAIRLLFQALAAAAVMTSLALLRRAGVEAGGLLLVGLNPITVVKGVNEGHVDVLLGLLLLTAVLAARRRPLLAAGLLGLAALVKPFALVAAVALVAWLLLRRGARVAAAAGAVSTALVGVGYLIAGGPLAIEPLREAGLQQSRTSLWAQPRLLLTQTWVDEGRTGIAAGRAARELVGLLALVTVAVVLIALVAIVLRRPDARAAPDPALVVSGAFAAYLVASVYVPAWYITAALPVAAVCWRSRLAIVLAVHGALLGIAYSYSPHLAADPLAPALRGFSTWVVPAAEAAFVALIVVRATIALVRAAPMSRRVATGPT